MVVMAITALMYVYSYKKSGVYISGRASLYAIVLGYRYPSPLIRLLLSSTRHSHISLLMHP